MLLSNLFETKFARLLETPGAGPQGFPYDDVTQPREHDPKTDIRQSRRPVLVVYPGRFQPMHQGHQAVFDQLRKRYGDSVYIVTSDKTEPGRSPFSFSDKQMMARAAGIPQDKVIQVKNPYNPVEITSLYDPNETILLFAVGAKDMSDDPRFKFGKKKDGTPTYLQQFKDLDHSEPMDRHGYVISAPTVEFEVLGQPAISATKIRELYAKSDHAKRDRILDDLYGQHSNTLRQMFDSRLGGDELSESVMHRQNKHKTLRLMKDFLALAKRELRLQQLPDIRWTSETTAHGDRPTFGKFRNDDNSVTVSIINRHPVDIMRTLAHELTHFKQHMTTGLDARSGETGSAEENQANAMAGIIMRKFDEMHPDAFETMPVQEPRLAEEKKAKGIDVEHAGNWTIEMSTMPVRMPSITGDTSMYVAKVTHKTKKFQPIYGTGKSQAEARDSALAKAQENVRPLDLDRYKEISVEFNSDFMREHWDPASGGMFKFARDDAGQTVLVMASRDYFSTFRLDMQDLGFKKGYVRKMDRENVTPTQTFSIGNQEMRDFGLIPNARYAVDNVGQDEDGNDLFSLTYDSRTEGPGEGYRMGRPGITIAATAGHQPPPRIDKENR